MDPVTVVVDVAGVRRALVAPVDEHPMVWHDLHRTLGVGTEVEVSVPVRGEPLPYPWTDLAVGAGFEVDPHEAGPSAEEGRRRLRLRTARTLADTVGPGMRLLVCGLNPSLHAADAGLGFVTASNRFWPAARRAGIVSADRDPVNALRSDGVGMTDIVKRATPRAAELSADEYRTGLQRLDRLCAWTCPRAVVMVGLAGWRAAADRSARPGRQPGRLGERPVYVMPSTSGLNARTSLDELAEHLRRAASG